jgi:hypothetical protein
MNIYEVAHYMSQGYRAKRHGWNSSSYVESIPGKQVNEFHIDDLLANDWEIILDGIVDDKKFPITYHI